MDSAIKGNVVKVHFTGKTENGNIFASSWGQEPLVFKIGEGEVLPGLEKAVIGMNVGERKEASITSLEAYGERNDELVFDIDKSQLPEGIPTNIGECLEFHYSDGTTLLLTIVGIHESLLKVDANHPLAGQNLTFDLQLLEIN